VCAVSYLALAAGVVAIAFVADRFVDAAARLADRLGVSALVIGVVVMGFGTSLPEVVVSASAAARGEGAAAIGNVVGSNVVNLTIVLGIAAVIVPITIRGSIVRREAPLALGAMLAYAIAIPVAGTNRVVAAVSLAVIGGGSLVLLLRTSRAPVPAEDPFEIEVTTQVHGAEARRAGEHLGRLGAITVVWLAGLVVASQVLLLGAEGVADAIGLSETATGVLLLAFGTSLPELAAAIAASRARESDLIVGNLWGSNLFNATWVGAAAIVAGPVPGTALWVLAVPLGAGMLAWYFTATERCIRRAEGVLLLVAGAGLTLALAL
jgi:cation:H+ antiporter